MLEFHDLSSEQFSEYYANAFNYLEKHNDHVNKLLNSAAFPVPPSGSDIFKPELWKDIHWAYFESLIAHQMNKYWASF